MAAAPSPAEAPAPPVLSYAKQPRAWLNRSQRWLATGAAALIAFNLLLPIGPPWRTLRIDICTECGSARARTATWFGHRRSMAIASTDLHAWLVARDGGHAHDWQFISESSSSGLRACGQAPPANTVRAFDGLLKNAPDAEIEKLAAALRQPDEKEQETAIERFADVVFTAPAQ